MNRGRENYSIQVIERAAQILRCFTLEDPSPSVADMGRRLGLHKATVHRILNALEKEGFVERDPASKRYRLGLVLLELGNVVQIQLDLRRAARPYLEEVVPQSGESAYLGVEREGRVLHIDKLEGPRVILARAELGFQAPLHCTAMGKVLLAYMTSERVDEIIRLKGLTPYTPNTISDREALLDHLERVRQQGYALDFEEVEVGLCCVAAPIRDHSGCVIAAMTTAGPSARLSRERMEELSGLMVRVTSETSKRLGYIAGWKGDALQLAEPSIP